MKLDFIELDRSVMTLTVQIENHDITEGFPTKNAPKFLTHFHYKEIEVGSHP